MTTERLDNIITAIRTFKRTATIAKVCAEGPLTKFFPEKQALYFKQASRRQRAVKRLSQTLAKECDRIKEAYQ